MAKKIGVLTFHRADNLGAVLQAYALQRVLSREFCVDAEIVDYQCETVENDRKKSVGLKKLALNCYYALKHRGFERFRRDYLKVSSRYNRETVASCVDSYDAFITGSDQVWNYGCSGSDDTYFLDFTTKKKYAYAASIGQFRFAPQDRGHVTALLRNFSGISVREASAREELRDMWPGNIKVCTDPVMLLSAKQWFEIMPKRLCRDKYVFVYMIMPSDIVMQKAEAYAKQHNCKVICNKTSPSFFMNGAPDDFLSWIYYADCIFTNSFHGTAFSLIMGKKLGAQTVCPDGKVNGRVSEILKQAKMEHCALENGMGGAPIDTLAETLQGLQRESMAYLKWVCDDI